MIELRVARDLHADWQTRHGPCAFRAQANIRDRELLLTFGAIDRVLSGDTPFRDLALSGLALGAVARLLVLQQAPGSTRPASEALTPARLRRVHAHVAANLSRDLTIRDLAGCVGLSPSHFGRAFKAETGQSPYAYVLRMRVERVQQLLRHGSLSLAEIAIDCGFATQSHMTETFRRSTGLPPAQWRRLHGAVSHAP
jgi:AraC family transcriptional regulator